MCEICEWDLCDWTPEFGYDNEDYEWVIEMALDRSTIIHHVIVRDPVE